MSSKKIRQARASANQNAQRVKLWKRGEESIYSKWWRKIVAKLFPKVKQRYDNAIGKWYKAQLKAWSKEMLAISKDKDYTSFYRARSKVMRGKK